MSTNAAKISASCCCCCSRWSCCSTLGGVAVEVGVRPGFGVAIGRGEVETWRVWSLGERSSAVDVESSGEVVVLCWEVVFGGAEKVEDALDAVARGGLCNIGVEHAVYGMWCSVGFGVGRGEARRRGGDGGSIEWADGGWSWRSKAVDGG